MQHLENRKKKPVLQTTQLHHLENRAKYPVSKRCNCRIWRNSPTRASPNNAKGGIWRKHLLQMPLFAPDFLQMPHFLSAEPSFVFHFLQMQLFKAFGERNVFTILRIQLLCPGRGLLRFRQAKKARADWPKPIRSLCAITYCISSARCWPRLFIRATSAGRESRREKDDSF